MSVLSVSRRAVFGVGRFGGGLGFFALGVLAPTLFKVVAPVVVGLLRPVIRGVVKGGVIVGREVQDLVGGVREDIEDAAAEVRQEAEAEPQPQKPARSRRTSKEN